MSLIEAICRDNIGLVKQLLSDSVDVKACEDEDCITPLHHAVQRNQLLVVKSLLAAGADPLAVTADGTSALELAQSYGFTAISNLLLQVINMPFY